MFRALRVRSLLAAASVFAVAVLSAISAHAADPNKIGFSMALTGGVAPNGKVVLAAFEIWRDDVNARGGLLGRPVELGYYDDQSNPANVPGLYTQLPPRAKAALLLGPHAATTNPPALPATIP